MMTKDRAAVRFTGSAATAAGVAVCLALSVGAPTVGAQATTGVEAPVLFDAVLPSIDSSVTVYAVSAEEASSGPMETWEMQTTSALSRTHYSARLDPEQVPRAAIRPGGLVDFEVVLTSEEGPRSTWTTARIVSVDGRLDWADPVETAHLANAAQTLGSADQRESVSRMAQQEAAELASTRADTGVLLTEFSPAPRTRKKTATVAAAGTCLYEYWIYTDTYRIRPTTIGTTYPVGKDTARMAVSSSQGANYGMALSSKTAYTGFSGNGSRFVQSGWSFTWAKSGEQRSYQKGIEYQLMRKACYGTGTFTPQYVWRPVGETGGVGQTMGLTRPAWKQYCQPVPEGKWSRDASSGSAYSYGAGVKFKSLIGIDLSVNRNYSSNQKITYFLKKDRSMCGNNAYPATASKIMARKA